MRFPFFVTSQEAPHTRSWGLIARAAALLEIIVDYIRAWATTPSNAVITEGRPTASADVLPLPHDGVPADTVPEPLDIQQVGSSQLIQAESQAGLERPEEVLVSSVAKPRLFSLLIGIDEYMHAGSGFHNLKGAVADADDMLEFLTATLGVDPSHIRNLRNHDATRDGILREFSALCSDDRIQPGDAIVIFYAGHGSQTAAPIGWEAGGRNAPVEMIIPHNFLPTTTPDVEQQGILDITLANLLSQLAKQKGDNITVIFDSCHSGSSTRIPLELDVLTRGFTLPDDYTILPSLMEPYEKRHASVTAGYENSGLASHVLLAACSRTESAKECNGRGFFTLALLALLRDVNLRHLTYRGVIEQLPDWPGQHPQCEGANSARVLFDGKAPGRSSVLYSVIVTQTARRENAITLNGGDIHGVNEGSEFDVFATRDVNASPLGRLIATKVHACSADLAVVTGSIEDIPQPAWALQATVGKRTDLVVAVPPGPQFDHLKRAVENVMRSSKRIIRFVHSGLPHELELQPVGDRAVIFITDAISIASGLTKLPASVPLDDAASLAAVVESAADFFFHLWRSNTVSPLSGKVVLEAFELTYKQIKWENHLAPRGPNLVTDGMIHLAIAKDKRMYGFNLVNNCERDLYVWAFMFDVSDLAIGTLYQPNLATSHPDPSLPGLGSLSLGYGSGGVAPRRFYLPEGINADVAYLKVFLTSEPVDLSYIAQESPFHAALSRRKLRKVPVRPSPVWDTALIAIVQKAVSIT